MTHVIYIPGLGDSYDSFRARALKWWPRLYGVSTELVSMNWSTEPELAPKLQRLEAAVRRATVDGKKVVLIGESVGAVISLISNTSEVSKVVTVCGVASGAIHIGDSYARRAGALRPAVDELRQHESAGTLPKNIQSYHAVFDEVVQKEHAVAKGANEHVLWSLGHMITITLGLTVLSWVLVNEAKRP